MLKKDCPINCIGNYVKTSEDYNMLNLNVLESMADWVRVVDYDGNVLYANRAMRDSLGDSILNQKCYYVHENKSPCGFCISKRSIRTNEVVQKEEVVGGRYFSVKSSPVLNKENKTVAAVEVFRDVTRERRLELELIKKNEKMSKDLTFAKQLQNKILPIEGTYGNLKVKHIYQPSEMLSGDMYDIYYIDKEHIGIYICDVVGHGVTASMMTMFVRQTMRSIKEEFLSPAETIEDLQKRFSALYLDTEKYFTIFYGIYNIKTKKFIYTNAGHNCIPIKFNCHSKNIELLKCTGFPISSVFADAEYRENSIELRDGDTILFYTDGITEVKNFDGLEFGIERIVNIVKEHEDDLIEEIVDNIERFRWGEQEDDFAIMLVSLP